MRKLSPVSRGSEVIRDLPEEGKLAVYGGRLHLVGKHWWVADGIRGPMRRLEGQIPGPRNHLRCLQASTHYGLVLYVAGQGDIYEVSFDE